MKILKVAGLFTLALVVGYGVPSAIAAVFGLPIYQNAGLVFFGTVLCVPLCAMAGVFCADNWEGF